MPVNTKALHLQLFSGTLPPRMAATTTKTNPYYHPERLEDGCWLIQGATLPACTEETAILYAAKHARTPEELEYLFWQFADRVWNRDEYEHHFSRHIRAGKKDGKHPIDDQILRTLRQRSFLRGPGRGRPATPCL